jgi:hypothetical protein
VALSTTEDEYMATTHASKKSVWLQRLCLGIRLVQQVARIDFDSRSEIFFYEEPILSFKYKEY